MIIQYSPINHATFFVDEITGLAAVDERGIVICLPSTSEDKKEPLICDECGAVIDPDFLKCFDCDANDYR